MTTYNALVALHEAVEAGGPFFMTVAPIGPHIGISGSSHGCNLTRANAGDLVTTPPVPQEKYQNSFLDMVVPRTPNFNPNVVG